MCMLYCVFLDSIVVSISACHAEDPGSIPGRGVFLLFFLLHECNLPFVHLSFLPANECIEYWRGGECENGQHCSTETEGEHKDPCGQKWWWTINSTLATLM